MKAKLTLLSLFIALAVIGSVRTEERVWDQERAMAMVKEIQAIEKQRPLPYEKVAWLTDVNKAEKLASQKQKPIFVYWYVDKGGPAASPC